MTGEIVRVFNRSDAPLDVMWSGRQWVLKPGENVIDLALIGHAKRQHRIMGTEDPMNPLDFESLVTCPGPGPQDGAECTNCRGLLGHETKAAKQSKAIEAINAKLLPHRKSREVVAVNGGFSRAMVANDMPSDANFSADRG